MIKTVKPNKKSRYKQGYFTPVNEEKYMGGGSKPKIIYRSSWEYKFCLLCDQNKSILKWSSETVEIKYIDLNDNKVHRYYPDFLIVVKYGDGIKKYLIEVKPIKDLTKPKPPKRKTQKAIKRYNKECEVYITNVSKMRAAKKYCSDRGWEFLYVTDKNWNKLFGK